VADHADLRTAAWIARSGLDLDDTIIDFRHFLSEQFAHEIRMRTAQENLLTAIVALNLGDDCADTLADAGGFTRDLLVAADDTFGSAQVYDHMAKFHRLNHTGDHFVGAVLELFILALTLSVANLLKDYLLGALCIDATKVDRRQRINDKITNLCIVLQLLGSLQIDLFEVVLDLFNHLDHTP